ncbi:MAG: hypothetical protein JNK64_06240 [Myxococcales bacterium]|nr:hypothetical protein [Myxococcales bacterium]
MTLSGIESVKDGRPNVRGVLVASDFDPTAPAGAAFGEQARRGHLLATSQAAGDFDPTALDPYLLPNSTSPFSAASFTYGTLERPVASGANVWSFFDCRDQADGAAVWTTPADCQANGFYYQQTARAWEGAPLPGTDNLYAGSTVTAVDEWGRVLSMRAEGDLRRTDDDTCTTVTYGSGAPFPSVVTSSVTTDCGTRTGTAITLAASRYLYDGLPFGQVSVGRLSSRWVDRYDANGVNLGTYQAGAYLYDGYGEVNVVIASRALGGAATRTTTITRDAFGSTVTNISESATGVPTVLAQKTAASTWASVGTATTDPSGVTTKVERDGFGRPTRTIVEANGQRWTLERLTYDDSTAGRRLVQESFPGSTPVGAEATASDVQRTTIVFDALARVRFSESELGATYGGRRIVSDFVERDALDRVVFAASPFEVAGPFVPDTVARHGVSYVFDERGRQTHTIEAIGKNLTATATDLAAKVYVTALQYTYAGGELTVRSQGPDDLDPTSTRYGWADESTMTAAGAEVRRVRRDHTGAVKDKVEQTWDRLGRVTETRRYQTPTSAVASTVWTNAYDSIGNLLRATEPGTARDSTYDEFGNQLETAWMDGTTRRVARTSYDGFSRVVAHELVSTTAGGAPVTESRDLFHYDLPSGDTAQPAVAATLLRGRLSWVEHPDVGNVYYGYDGFGRPNAEVYQYRDLMGVVTQTSESTVGGRLEALRLTTDATDDNVTYSYDSAGRTRSITTDDERLFSATDVTALGQYQRVELGNGVVENFAFAATGRRELLSWTADTRSGTYTYANQTRDAAGRITSELHTTPGATTQWSAGYDGMGRLLTRVQSSSLVPQVEMFTYDGLGNMASRTNAVGATFQYTPSTGDGDRLCRYAAPNTGTACQFTYDGAGNVIEDRATGEVRAFVYDAGQRITQITRGATKVELTYGPVGRMKTEVMGPTARTIWTFGGLIERRLRRDGVTQIERAIPGPLGTFVSLRSELDDRGAVTAKESVYRHGDGRANRFFTRSDGKVAQEATYGVFGQVTAGGSDGGFTGSDDLWNGGDDLPEIGVTLLGPRAYDPLLGRFLQRDPIAILARSTTANPYSFAFSDPVNNSDPTGLSPPGAGTGSSNCGSECQGMAWEYGMSLIGIETQKWRQHHRKPRGVGLGTDRVKVDPKAVIANWRVCNWDCQLVDGVGAVAGKAKDLYVAGYRGQAAGTKEFLEGTASAVTSIPGCIDPRAGCSIKMLTGQWDTAGQIVHDLRTCDGAEGCVETAMRHSTREGLNYAAGEGVTRGGMAVAGKIKGWAAAAGIIRRSTPMNRVGKPYPQVRNPGTGELVPYPGDGFAVVPEGQRTVWTNMDRHAFIKEWHDRGFKAPPGGWDEYDIHHIRPLKFGGTNAFDNLVPVLRTVHQTEFNVWWTNY